MLWMKLLGMDGEEKHTRFVVVDTRRVKWRWLAGRRQA